MSTTTVITEPQPDIELHPLETQPDNTINAVSDDGKSSLDRKTALKLIASGFSFFFAGTNDSSLGPLTPYILRTYAIGPQHIALMYIYPITLPLSFPLQPNNSS